MKKDAAFDKPGVEDLCKHRNKCMAIYSSS